MTSDLHLHAGDTLVDLGCGMAGPALWAARETGAKLIGVDFSSVAVALASERAHSLGLSDVARFVVGSFENSGSDDMTADAVMSEDALQYAPNKAAAVKEAARILRPGGRLVFTAFELDPSHVVGLPAIGDDPVDDYRPCSRRQTSPSMLTTRYLDGPSRSARRTSRFLRPESI